MRFHKFKDTDDRDMVIDLDQVRALRDVAGFATVVYFDQTTHTLLMPLDDVLALISPAAAPDTYEEQLRAKTGFRQYPLAPPEPKQRERGDPIKIFYPDKYGIIRELEAGTPEAMSETDRRARLDELERFRVLIRSGCSWDYLDQHISRRRTEIEQGA